MPVPGRLKLGQWGAIFKKTSSERATPTFISVFDANECLSPLFFPSSSICKRRLFNKAFNISS